MQPDSHERSNEPQSSQTGVLATLANLLRARGTSAPSTSFANGSSAPAGSPNSLAAGRSAVRRLALLTALASFGCLLAAGPAAAASEPEPWWHLTQRVIPSEIEPGGEGVIVVQAINLGNASTSGRYEFTDHLPPGLTLKKVEYFAPFLPAKPQRSLDMAPLGYCTTTASSASCSNESPKQPPEPKYVLEPVAPYEFLELRLKVKDNGAEPGALNEFTAGGGGATPLSAARPVAIGEAPIPFGLESFRLTPEEEGGATATRAGSHPYQLTTNVTFNRASPESFKPPALPRNLHFKLPPGMIGNALITPQCQTPTSPTSAPAAAPTNAPPTPRSVRPSSPPPPLTRPVKNSRRVPVFNLTPPTGSRARFGFEVIHNPVILDTSMRSGRGEDYGVTVTVTNITQIVALLSSTTTFWGAPADPSHNEARGWGCLLGGKYRGDRPGILCEPANILKPSAFLTLPTDCAHPFNPLFEGISWPNQAAPGGVEAEPLEYDLEDGAGHPLGLTACNQVPFSAEIDAEPTSTSATSPTGFKFDLNVKTTVSAARRLRPVRDQESRRHPARRLHHQPLGRRRAEGVLGGSQSHDGDDRETAAPTNRRSARSKSKARSQAEVLGSLFVARQKENPYENLLTIYMVLRTPNCGVMIKQALKVEPNETPASSRPPSTTSPSSPSATSTSNSAPAAIPLVTPPSCGTYTVLADLFPCSDPQPPSSNESSFEITPAPKASAAQTGDCPPSPNLVAGSMNPAAGTYCPFNVQIPATTPNRRSPTSRSSCRREWSATSPACRCAPTPRSCTPSPLKRSSAAAPKRKKLPRCPAA